MLIMPEPFLGAEIKYRQLRAMKLYDQKPSRGERRHRWVPRLPSLSLPRRMPRRVQPRVSPRRAGSPGGGGLTKTAE
jgi:hypothetical protein